MTMHNPSTLSVPRRCDDHGRPIPGMDGIIYMDDVARQGYQVYSQKECEAIKPGDFIPVGTSYSYVLLDDPRPGTPVPNDGSKKCVRTNYAEVTWIGDAYKVVDEITVEDEDNSYCGCRKVGGNNVNARNVYFRGGAGQAHS